MLLKTKIVSIYLSSLACAMLLPPISGSSMETRYRSTTEDLLSLLQTELSAAWPPAWPPVEAVGSLAREMAAELLKGVESVELLHFIKQHQGTSDVICGDGNCQFSSFAFCYGGMDHQVAREEACRWLETNWSRTLVAISVIFGYVATLHFWRAHQATCLDQGQPEVLRLHH
ncbi:unnamed protein product [Symbiodinium sp. KB8]|nr:unnamed protein product [Symbiodinium sp. KB8]